MEERTTDLNILPSQYQEFTNKQYWDRFFQQLNEKTFEWYGKTEDIYSLISSALRKDSKLLMIGCGNSNFSSDLYDSGYHSITNVDYSDVVIQEMKRKNDSRPEMKWDVGDVTDLSQLYSTGQFDVVLDKGTLDAILSENTAELVGKTRAMFREISRVLNEHGTYICISLAQDFILHYLLETFLPSSWEIEVGYIHQMSGSALSSSSSSSSSASSPLHPFVFKISKKSTKSSVPITLSSAARSSSIEEVKVQMDPMGNPYPHFQGKPLELHQLPAYIRHIQEFYLLKHSTRTFEIGKFETLHFWTSEKAATAPVPQSSLDSIPRYTLYILDANAQGSLQMAVFIIPFGRESDYQFTSKDGLLDLAFQANCKRLIAVSCNRPYPYPQLKTLQDELSPIILSLKLSTMSDREFIPYMAISHDHTWEVIAQGDSNVSGIYIIEEKSDAPVKNKKKPEEKGGNEKKEEIDEEEDEEEEEKKTGVYRRLIFLQNQQFVQTEVHLIDPSLISASEEKSVVVKKKKGSSSNSSKKKKNQTAGKAKGGANPSTATGASSLVSSSTTGTITTQLVFDYQYLDDHHKAFLLAFCLNDALIRSVSVPYTSDSTPSFPHCLLIGLGGGSLPMILHKYYPSLYMRIIEIDEVVYDLAKQYFGYTINPEIHDVIIEEGVHYLQQQYHQLLSSNNPRNTTSNASTSEALEGQFNSLTLTSPMMIHYYDVIAIDVDCKDPSLGLSAPPKEFISNDTLHKLYALLSPTQGMLLINTVARNKSLFQQLIDRLKIIFQVSPNEVTGISSTRGLPEGRILQLQANTENVNVCLICLKNGDMPFLPRTIGGSSNTSNSNSKKSAGGGSNALSGEKKFTKNQLQIKLQVAVEQSLKTVLSNSRDSQDSLTLTPLIEKFQIL